MTGPESRKSTSQCEITNSSDYYTRIFDTWVSKSFIETYFFSFLG